MTDADSMVMSLRLAWLKRLFGTKDEYWKRYLLHLLESYGGFFFFKSNYDIRDYPNLPQFFFPSFCNGGPNSEKCLHLKRIGFT